ncbi:MAG: hypothetical protein M0R03_13145 [Novosphingobium sp.]|nr:hypothetical protein [Novosphingobium sp.]
MKVKDLIWELQQIHNQEKEVAFGNSNANESFIHSVVETEFRVYIKD